MLTAVCFGLVAWWALAGRGPAHPAPGIGAAVTPDDPRRRPTTATPCTASHRPARCRAPAGAPGPRQAAPHPLRGFLAKAALVTAVLSVAGALLGLVPGPGARPASSAPAPRPTPSWSPGPCPSSPRPCSSRTAWPSSWSPRSAWRWPAGRQGARRRPGPRPGRRHPAPPVRWPSSRSSALLDRRGAATWSRPSRPGLPDPRLAVDCTRLTATCVLSFGLAGYCSAALRAHRRFVAPAAIYVAYNIGIIAAMFVLGAHWGVRSAALGVAVGGVPDGAVQAPVAVAAARPRPRRTRSADERRTAAADPALTAAPSSATVLLFALCRQSQVLIERFLASSLPAGAISHLNYAQKVAQMPMVALADAVHGHLPGGRARPGRRRHRAGPRPGGAGPGAGRPAWCCSAPPR